ncbi:MAG: 23S rRNA (uracil(1939)-C(5))-methyltransferase RlmD [Candidatus Latescibacterota bacterium]|nr:23S rRNA (uracil(1939)-C(5))-methyltransferase RlmD [Candidatus Latescibacterota bacterium]
MKQGDRIEVEVSALNAKGDGLGYVGGREVLVRRAVPGDKVGVRLVKKRKGRFEAEIEEFLAMGYERQQARCEHFGLCGGCRWQELTYQDQLKVKEQMVADALATSELAVPQLEPILPSPDPFFYRNKMEFSFGCDRDGLLQLGLHVRGRFNWIFNLRECHLQSQVSNRIVESVRRTARELLLSAYDLKRHEGLLRFLVVRDGKRTGQVMVNLVVASYPEPVVDHLVEKVLAEVGEIDVLLVTLHTGKAQVAAGEREFLRKGSGHIVEECAGLKFDISPQSFFQTNPLQAERLYEIVTEMAGTPGAVLDVYCGTGSISLLLAGRAQSVLGIEVVAEAVEDARHNAERNGVEHCEFIAGAAEDILGDLATQGRRFDLVVVDPPRAGLHKKVLAGLSAFSAPRIIYVSCNPHTLASDLSTLGECGYHIVRVRPVDMFPQTPHCEVVTELCQGECLTN